MPTNRLTVCLCLVIGMWQWGWHSLRTLKTHGLYFSCFRLHIYKAARVGFWEVRDIHILWPLSRPWGGGMPLLILLLFLQTKTSPVMVLKALDMVVHTGITSSWQAEAVGLTWVQGHNRLCDWVPCHQDLKARLYLTTKQYSIHIHGRQSLSRLG